MLKVANAPKSGKEGGFCAKNSGVVVVVVTPHPFTVAREWNSNQGAEGIHILVFSAEYYSNTAAAEVIR